MKKTMAFSFALWLFLGSLFPKTDMEELCKVPILFQHYINEHADLSFWQYLKMHYSENSTHQDVGNEHSQLPMQNHSHFCAHFLFTDFRFSYSLLNQICWLKNTHYNFFWQNNYRFYLESSLYSPPKFS
ncbi:MAG: hypothetical protein EAZ06_07270 [Cytophagales bacterium]|nr:MAG: hypothetical protein EAZ06_07270 [Cytophagales bacterium]